MRCANDRRQNFAGGCSRGTTGTGAICPGAQTAIPTASGFRRSCCSRRGSRRSSRTITNSCGGFPRLEKLAAAREASVLAAWSGLGYYRRARMLHAAAKVVVREYGGKFPPTAKNNCWRCRAFGRYTAAAIASIAFGEPVAVVDGNVERVLQRVSGKRLAR